MGLVLQNSTNNRAKRFNPSTYMLRHESRIDRIAYCCLLLVAMGYGSLALHMSSLGSVIIHQALSKLSELAKTFGNLEEALNATALSAYQHASQKLFHTHQPPSPEEKKGRLGFTSTQYSCTHTTNLHNETFRGLISNYLRPPPRSTPPFPFSDLVGRFVYRPVDSRSNQIAVQTKRNMEMMYTGVAYLM